MKKNTTIQKQSSSVPRKIDTSNLSIGMVVKNYKELCSLLDQEVLGGDSKKSQLSDFKCYFDYEKSRQKFIITDIYDEPLEKDDKRNYGIYTKYVEFILLQYLAQQDGYKKILTKREWWELLGMINGNYNRVSYKKLQEINNIITPFEVNNFYQRCNKKLEQILFSALNSLKNRKLVIWEMQTILVKDNEEGKDPEYHIADDIEKSDVLDIERYILTHMGYDNMFEIFCNNKQKEYYHYVNMRLKELYGWDHYYRHIKIIYTKKYITEVAQEAEIQLQKELLNNKVTDVLNEQAKKKYLTEKEKKETIEDDTWGEKDAIEEKKSWQLPDTYLEAQRILTNELINIGHKNKSIVNIEELNKDSEMDQLINSFSC